MNAKDTVVTFRPPEDVRSLLKKAKKRRLGVSQTFLICEAIRAHFAALAGKREQQ